MWVIKFKDIDPDTGEISQEQVLAQSMNPLHADMICEALALADFDQPNRVYFSVHHVDENDNDKS
jgi:hypothetical protein